MVSIEELISISREMLNEAKSDHWQNVVDLEAKRRTKLEAYFEQVNIEKLSENDIAHLRDAIADLLRFDAEIEALGIGARKEAAQLLKELKSARQAVNAYRDNSIS